MKFVPVAAPLLAVTIVPAIADNAVAYPTESIKDGLKAAICAQDWNEAINLSGNLIASSEITPELRQSLVDWRQRFSNSAKGQVKLDSVPNCQGVQRNATEIRVTPYQAPRFSKTTAAATSPCYMDMGGVRTDLSYMCGSDSQPVLSVAAPVVVTPAPTAQPALPEIELVSADISRTRFLRNSNQTRVTALVTFDRQAPEYATGDLFITVSGSAVQSRPVFRSTGRVQDVEFYLPGRVSNSAIDAEIYY